MYTTVRVIIELESGVEQIETFEVEAATVADALDEAERQARQRYAVKSIYTDLVS